MIVDLTGVLKEPGNRIPVDGVVTADDVNYLGEEFHIIEMPRFTGEISNNGKSLVLRGTVRLRFAVKCARCRKDIERDFEYELDETLVREKDNSDDNPDVFVFSGNEADITDIVLNGFFMNVPGKFLCREDCKGLCPECGADLNEGDCGCSDDMIDPRWEALKKIMDGKED